MHGKAEIVVETAGPSDAAAWDAFVEAAPEATFFHRFGWRAVVERALGHRAHYLLARVGGAVVGVLPLTEIRSYLFGHGLVSNAFCVYGGPVGQSPQIVAALDEAACALADRLGVDHLEYRLRGGPLNPGRPAESELYVTFRKPIEADGEANLKAIPRKQRASVRKGIKAGLASRVEAGVDRTWAVYAESVRNLGTPVIPRRYFRVLKEIFGADCEPLLIEHEGRAVAAVLSFYFRGEVLPYYGGSTLAARPLSANDFMYWEVMRRACESGCRIFDFGRSKVGTGAFKFKKYWGFEPEPLHYEFYLCKGGRIPQNNPTNPRYRLAIQAWQKLPLWLANRLGPPIAKDLG